MRLRRDLEWAFRFNEDDREHGCVGTTTTTASGTACTDRVQRASACPRCPRAAP